MQCTTLPRSHIVLLRYWWIIVEVSISSTDVTGFSNAVNYMCYSVQSVGAAGHIPMQRPNSTNLDMTLTTQNQTTNAKTLKQISKKYERRYMKPNVF